jgi:hypothetical protein
MDFWPDDLRPTQVRSPKAIMLEAASQLTERFEQIKVNISETQLEDRTVLSFLMLNREFGSTLSLFEVNYRRGFPYPALIVPPSQAVPQFLIRKQYVPAPFEAMPPMLEKGRFLENPWVCGTPSEFSSKLGDLLQRDSIKSIVFSFLAMNPPDASQTSANDKSAAAEEEPEES